MEDLPRPLPRKPAWSGAASPPQIPHYELIKIIGEGSYGAVWLARTQTGSFRAVKVVYRHTFDDNRPYEREFDGIKRFEPISRLHPSQIDVLHVGRDDDAGFFYYVMELADDATTTAAEPPTPTPGGRDTGSTSGSSSAPKLDTPETYQPRTLRNVLREHGQLPAVKCVHLALGLAEALDELHSHGLVHRDIKPSNIIFSRDRPKLADIGLVAQADATLSYVGTEGYIPPEGPGKPQADIFSLGMVLYEAMSGNNRKQFPEPPSLLDAEPDLRTFQALNDVILKACDDSTTNRYATAAEMARDLRAIQEGKSVRWRHWRSRWARGGVKATAVATLLVAAFALLPQFRPAGPRRIIHSPRIIQDLGPKLGLDDRHRPRDYDPSVDGMQVLYSTNWTPFLYNALAPAVSIPILADTAARWKLRLPRWAPDTESFAILGVPKPPPGKDTSPQEQATLFVATLTPDQGGARAIDDDLVWGRVTGMTWDPSGRFVTVLNVRDSLMNVHLDGLKEVWLRMNSTTNFPDQIGNYSPNGKWLVATKRFREIWLFNSTEERRLVTAKPRHEVFHPSWSPRGDCIYYIERTPVGSGTAHAVMRLEMDGESGGAQGQPEALNHLLSDAAWHPLGIELNGEKLSYLKVHTIKRIYYSQSPDSSTTTEIAQGRDPQISPDGKSIYYKDPDTGRRGIYLASPDFIVPRLLVPEPNLDSFDLCPDGNRLAITTVNSERIRLFVTDVNRSRHVELFAANATSAFPPSWSPDGTLVTLALDNQTVVVVRADGSGLARRITLPWMDEPPRWSPSGEALAVAACADEAARDDEDAPWRVLLLPMDDGPPIPLTPPDFRGYMEGMRWHPGGEFVTFHRYPPAPNLSGEPDTIWQAFTNGRPPTPIIDQADGHWDYFGSWHPGGRHFYFLSNRCPHGGNGIHIFDRETDTISHHSPLSQLPSWDAAGIHSVLIEHEIRLEGQLLDL